MTQTIQQKLPQKISDEDKPKSLTCFHCGDLCRDESIYINDKVFCCNGCKAVYQMLNESSMCDYYSYNENAGIKPVENILSHRFSYLDDEEIIKKLVEFSDGKMQRVTFYIPQMHCSSCIYLLEKLYKIQNGIQSSRVHFLRKEATISFDAKIITLRQVVELLAKIGYEPKISLANLEKKSQYSNLKKLYLKIGLAGFAFGNVMLLSFPDYLARLTDIPAEFARFFGFLSLLLATPALLYSGRDYFISAFTGLKQNFVNIDVPISLGMFVLYIRSAYEIFFQIGAGYLDSLTGLIFFLLVGKLFQQKTYDTLSFERDYKSFFPIAITVIKEGLEKMIPLSNLLPGSRIIVRNHELIPADSILINGAAAIDYSFVTGESNPVVRKSGDLIYAGGRQIGPRLELEVVKDVSQSYLTRLWNDHNHKNPDSENNITHNVDIVSRYFTFIVLAIATTSGFFWYFSHGMKEAINVFTSVLIVACPCALALSYPFTMGNAMRLMGRKKLFLKNVNIVEQMARINGIIFDKTGTLTHTQMSRVNFSGTLEEETVQAVKTIVSHSNHPINKQIQTFLNILYPNSKPVNLSHFEEFSGKGIIASTVNQKIFFGSKKWLEGVLKMTFPLSNESSVYLVIDRKYIGYFSVKHTLREGVRETITELRKRYRTSVLSGDIEAERSDLQQVFGNESPILFNQGPDDKVNYVLKDKSNHIVMMIGDGLNDGAALQASDLGISIIEDTAQFTPASDGILEAQSFQYLPQFLSFAKSSVKIVIASFILSFLYNTGGLFFAIRGDLTPILAAILMPLSSISVIAFSTIMTTFIGARKGMLR